MSQHWLFFVPCTVRCTNCMCIPIEHTHDPSKRSSTCKLPLTSCVDVAESQRTALACSQRRHMQQQPRRLIEWRALHNLSQVRLAQAAGVSDFVVRKMERGESVQAAYAAKVLAVLGVTAEQVAGLKISNPLEYRINRSFVSGAISQKGREQQ